MNTPTFRRWLMSGIAVVTLLCSCADPDNRQSQQQLESIAPQQQATIAEPEQPSPIPETTEIAPTESEPQPEPAPAPIPSEEDGLSAHEVKDGLLSTVFETVARNLEAQKLAYVASLGQDCSGIYHRIKDSVQARVPALRDRSKYIYPTYARDRSSRQIAYWYHQNNYLHIA